MSDNIDTIRAQLWEKMRSKTYRDNFVGAHLSTNVAAQIQAMREDRGWKQKDLAAKTEMSPARISIMEDPSYDRFNLSTLRRLASAFDVALSVRFVPFSELVTWVANLSPEKMAVPEFERDSIGGRDVSAGFQFQNTLASAAAVAMQLGHTLATYAEANGPNSRQIKPAPADFARGFGQPQHQYQAQILRQTELVPG